MIRSPRVVITFKSGTQAKCDVNGYYGYNALVEDLVGWGKWLFIAGENVVIRKSEILSMHYVEEFLEDEAGDGPCGKV
jgi:hypothetical protein